MCTEMQRALRNARNDQSIPAVWQTGSVVTMLSAVAYRQMRRVRLGTAFPFGVGVFTGTLITAFLCLALRSVDEEVALVGGLKELGEYREGAAPREEEESVRRQGDYSSLPSLNDPKLLISYNVLTSPEQLRTRGLAIRHTWGENVKASLEIYLSPSGREDDITFAFNKKMPIASLAAHGGSDSQSPTQGVFQTLSDICTRKLGQYQWFMKLRDTAYLRPAKLEAILRNLNSSAPLLIGRPKVPQGDERNELGLREGQYYCSGEGYVLSSRTLELICPALQHCRENMQSANEDVELSRCVQRHAKVNCTTAYQVGILIQLAKNGCKLTRC